MSGKGSAPRPYSVPMETFNENFERIFGKPPSIPIKPETEEEARLHESQDKVERAG